jgi:hypothetical protein
MTEDFCQHYSLHRPPSTLKDQIPEEFTLNYHHNIPGIRKSSAHLLGQVTLDLDLSFVQVNLN